jgi:hypothetical protein
MASVAGVASCRSHAKTSCTAEAYNPLSRAGELEQFTPTHPNDRDLYYPPHPPRPTSQHQRPPSHPPTTNPSHPLYLPPRLIEHIPPKWDSQTPNSPPRPPLTSSTRAWSTSPPRGKTPSRKPVPSSPSHSRISKASRRAGTSISRTMVPWAKALLQRVEKPMVRLPPPQITDLLGGRYTRG